MASWLIGTNGCDDCPGCGADPCTSPAAPEATIDCDTISASLTKCGFEEFGTPSTPPKIYLTKSQSGSRTASNAGFSLSDAYSGSETYSRISCGVSDTRLLAVTATYDFICSGTVNYNGSQGGADVPNETGPTNPHGCVIYGLDSTCSARVAENYCCSGPTVTSQTTETFPDLCGGYSSESSTVAIALSNEYTTAQLKADVISVLPDYPETWDGTCSSLQDLSSDELTDSIRRVKFRFTFPDLTGFTCWGFNYSFIFHPDDHSGNVNILIGRYDWNGTDTELIIEILEAAQYGFSGDTKNGVITLDSVTYDCACP